ncbi:MAG: S-layer homology domain-containing protein [Cyanobacteria bacterium P01_A01_bin.37]
MTNSLPPDPERRRERDDERIGVFVALAAIGAILFWGLSRGENGLNLAKLNLIPDTTSGAVSDEFSSEELDADGDLFEDSDIGLLGGSDDENSSGPFAGVSRFNPFNRDSDLDDASDIASGIDGSENNDSGITIPAVPPVVPTDILPDINANEGDTDTEDGDPGLSVDEPSEEEPVAQIEPVQEAIAFADIGDTFWAKPFIDSLSERAIISGFEDNSYRPDGNITRAQFAASLEQAFGDESKPEEITYIDVASDYWGNAAIQKVTDIGFMTGYPENDFRPDNGVTKIEVLVALVTGLNLTIPDDPEAVLQMYQDRDEIPDWAVEKIAAATEAGLVVNHPELPVLAPSKSATRAEAAATIYQALLSQGLVPAVESEFIVTP